MAPQVGFEPTTLRLTAVRVKTLSAVSSVAYRGVHPKSRPQLGYMGYSPRLGAEAESRFAAISQGSRKIFVEKSPEYHCFESRSRNQMTPLLQHLATISPCSTVE
jgi:hypothetical protein